jgi:hypothetical protein
MSPENDQLSVLLEGEPGQRALVEVVAPTAPLRAEVDTVDTDVTQIGSTYQIIVRFRASEARLHVHFRAQEN